MTSKTHTGRCNYVLDPEEWQETHEEGCYVSRRNDEEILTEKNGSFVWECPHPAEENKDKCLFHLPEEEQPSDSELVSEFLDIVNKESTHDNISDRPPQFIDANFGDLDIRCSKLGSEDEIDLRHATVDTLRLDVETVTVPLNIGRIQVRQEADLSNTIFESKVDCLAATFHDEAEFQNSVFKGELVGRGQTFEGDADFEEATFESECRIPETTFNAYADFSETEFEGRSKFHGVTFEDGGSFRLASFNSRVTFLKMTSGSWLRYNGATFEGEVDFRETTLDWTTFIKTTFHNKVRFEEAEVVAEADFQQATFNGEIDCEQAIFREANFQNASFHAEAAFQKTLFKAVEFIETTFHEQVDFSNAVFRYVDAQEAVFRDDVSFRATLSDQFIPYTPFQGRTNFSGATVRGIADFRILDTDETVVSERLTTFQGRVDFSNSQLENAEFDGVTFAERGDLLSEDPPITFADSDLTGASFRSADCSQVNFTNADLTNTTCATVDFTAANLEGAILSRANLYEADFTNTRLHGTIFGDARISDGTKFIDSGSWWTWLPKCTRGMQTVVYDPRTGPVVEDSNRDDLVDPYSRAASVYTQLETLASTNAASGVASTCFRWRKDMQRKRYWDNDGESSHRQWARYVFSKLTNLSTRYGDSPWRVVGWSFAVVGTSTLLFWLTDGVRSAQTAGVSTPDWLAPLYFSLVTFTTLGYGDFQPANQCAQLLAGVEALLGSLLLALLIAVLGRRATR
ncbi:pentapeptide repeat-containing protein [Haloarchaeobius sp. FL176]|uniref:pentapeptide repeat-containing protein n=1 Tax=Haloarchaeobius sp. FL176 TaxID=2967129 RepID=UPI0021492A6B|nr:pentapeptide repeat-containing protein [Haloarchaeobius sp. FL176]